MTLEPIDLFVGQTIALLPRAPRSEPDSDLRYQLMRLFPRAMGETVSTPRGPLRPQIYSVIIDGNSNNGVLTIGGVEIPVVMQVLVLDTPAEATAFHVVALSGRAMRIKGVAEGESFIGST